MNEVPNSREAYLLVLYLSQCRTEILRLRDNTNRAHSAHKPKRELLCLWISVVSGEIVNGLYNPVKDGQVNCPDTRVSFSNIIN